MTTTRRAIALLALVLSAVLGASAFTAGALAYPPGTKAHVTLSSSRVDPGGTITVSGTAFRTKARVVITVTCRSSNPDKSYTATYRAKASSGAFSQTITIGPEFPKGRCKITARTGKSSDNSDSATFFVNTPSHEGDSANQVKLASLNGGIPTAGTGSSWGAVLTAGLALLFLFGGSILMLAGRRKHAIVRS